MKTKKILIVFVAVFSFLGGNAQYKKVTMKEKAAYAWQHSGITLGGTMHFMGNGKGTPNSFYLGLATIGEEKRWFNWASLAVMLPAKFSYGTLAAQDNSNWTDAVTITGKTKPVILGELNWGCFLHNVENTEAKIKPYLSFGLNGHADGGIDENTINRYNFPVTYYSFQKEPSSASIGVGVKGGAGILIQFIPAIALKLDGGYNFIGNLSYESPGPGLEESNYFAYTSNPYASAGFVFLFGRK